MRIVMRDPMRNLIEMITAAFVAGMVLVGIWAIATTFVKRANEFDRQTSAAITVPNDGWRIKLYYKSPEGIEKELDAYIAIPGYIFKIESVTTKDAK
jgi:hypothetical protein